MIISLGMNYTNQHIGQWHNPWVRNPYHASTVEEQHRVFNTLIYPDYIMALFAVLGYALVCSGNFTYPSKVTHESRLIMMNYLLNIAMFIHFPCLSLITRGIQRVYSISKQTQSLPKGYTPWWYGCFLGVTASHRRLCCNFYSCLGSCYSVQLALPQAFGYGQRNLKRIPNR